MQTVSPKKPNIYRKIHRSGRPSWCVNIGKKAGGQADVQYFKTEELARNFANEWNLNFVTLNNPGLSDLSNFQRHDVLAALERIKAYGTTLTEVVDFFIRNARPSKPNVLISEAMEIFLKAKTEKNCRSAYIQNFRKTFLMPFSKKFKGKLVTDLTIEDAEKYISNKSTWNAVTKRSHINYLSTFYNFLIKQRYAKLNPFENLTKPTPDDTKTKFLRPSEVKTLLQFALDKGRTAECATMALVFFCGVRVDEAGRLNWDQLELGRARVKIECANAKKRRRRVNEIAPNALEWLRLCETTGRIAPNDYSQRMKRLRNRTGISYPQNAMRHCFASYHLAKHESQEKTSKMLSHSNSSMLYGTYYDVVTKEQADEFWNIVPNSIVAKRQKEEQEKDNSERDEALSASNCGKVVRDEFGSWHPLQNEGEILPESLAPFSNVC